MSISNDEFPQVVNILCLVSNTVIYGMLQMEERTVKERQDEEQRVKEAELARIAELEKPAPDELYGMRVHCWVLVLAGKREVLDRFILTF